jgi:fido (protein-threonine AMPylation protein)
VKSRSSYQHDRNVEIFYLKELISSFGTQCDLQAEEAIKIIYARFSELEKKRSDVLRSITNDVNGYYQLCLKVHAFLYQDILGNAGQIRQSGDPNGGNVYFGGIAQRTMKDKFIGTEPEFIKLELYEAFSIFFNKQYDYQKRSIRFYAEFVAIHPFYDANGRIGRYIVDTYLQYHRYYVDWQSINKSHGKFLRKINYCHSVRTRYKEYLALPDADLKKYKNKVAYWEFIREKYLDYLLNFWSQFIDSISNIEN